MLKLNTTEMSQCCLTNVFDQYFFILKPLAHCTVSFKSYRMFVRMSRPHSMLLFFAGKNGKLYCLLGG